MLRRMSTRTIVTEIEVPRVSQSGFPADAAADEFYAGCVQGWTDTLGSFLQHARGVQGQDSRG